MEYYEVDVGFEFVPHTYKMDPANISEYLTAVQETHSLYSEQGLVPPLAVTAYALAASSSGITFPAGTIHVFQELEFFATVKVGDTIICYAKVSRKQQRGGLFLMATDIQVYNQFRDKILYGRIGFVLPEPDPVK